MEREIRFRGKGIDTEEWIIGSLVETNCGHFGIAELTRYSNEKIDCIIGEVDPKTVGQFSGFTDRNGKEIYEGDIVQLDYITTIGKHRIGIPFEVKWCTQEGCWIGWDGFVENALQQTCKMFVVKGNIYDNPELLK